MPAAAVSGRHRHPASALVCAFGAREWAARARAAAPQAAGRGQFAHTRFEHRAVPAA
jgi:hypothetical protein